MKRLLIEGKEYIERERGEMESVHAFGPTRFYRDLAGVVRVYAASPNNVPIEATELPLNHPDFPES